MKALYLDDNWKVVLMAMEERFTVHQEQEKDHEKLLVLKYQGDMQTYLAKYNELNSRVGLSGEALMQVIITVSRRCTETSIIACRKRRYMGSLGGALELQRALWCEATQPSGGRNR